MEVGKLTVQFRDTTGKGISRRLRQEGSVPGVCYGAGMESPLAVAIDPKALKAALDPDKKRNTLIDVTIEKDGASHANIKAMLWDYQVHPLKQVVTHVDLKSIDPNKVVEAEVPVVPTGKHAGAIEGGLLSWARHNVTVSAKPADIPTKLVLDITPLKLGDAMHVANLSLPEGVEFVSSTKLTLVTCVAPKGAAKKGAAVAEEEAVEAEGAEAEKK
jgi:large subunit ribosomal protein L25